MSQRECDEQLAVMIVTAAISPAPLRIPTDRLLAGLEPAERARAPLALTWLLYRLVSEHDPDRVWAPAGAVHEALAAELAPCVIPTSTPSLAQLGAPTDVSAASAILVSIVVLIGVLAGTSEPDATRAWVRGWAVRDQHHSGPATS